MRRCAATAPRAAASRCAAEKPLITTTRRCPNRARYGPYCRTHALSLGYATPITKMTLEAIMSGVMSRFGFATERPLDAAETWDALRRQETQP